MTPQIHEGLRAILWLFFPQNICDEEWAHFQVHMAYCTDCLIKFRQIEQAAAFGTISEHNSSSLCLRAGIKTKGCGFEESPDATSHPRCVSRQFLFPRPAAGLASADIVTLLNSRTALMLRLAVPSFVIASSAPCAHADFVCVDWNKMVMGGKVAGHADHGRWRIN
jgi:hypothetical protein